jgi:hypothetical protein
MADKVKVVYEGPDAELTIMVGGRYPVVVKRGGSVEIPVAEAEILLKRSDFKAEAAKGSK